jgi:nitroreductase
MDGDGFYEVVHRRRDVRGEFTGASVPPEVLRRILEAAHAAPSVGLSQPWDFVLVRDVRTRRAFREHVLRERAIFADQLDAQQAATFSRIRVEGVLESSLGIVACTRCAWRSRTCGSPRPPRASEWAGSASTGRSSCDSCCTSHLAYARWPGSA